MQENQIGNVVCKIAVILSPPQLVTQYSVYDNLSAIFTYGFQGVLIQIALWLPDEIIPGTKMFHASSLYIWLQGNAPRLGILQTMNIEAICASYKYGSVQ